MEVTQKPLRFIIRWLVSIGFVCMLAACGFHLRGDFKFAFKSMYLDPPGSPVFRLIKRLNRGMQTTEIVDNPKKAEVILSVLHERQKQKTLSYDNHGDAREYALYYRVTYSLRTQKGRELIEPTTITLRRTMTYDESEDLAKEREKKMLYADMQQDIAQQILRRLSKVTMEEGDALPQEAGDDGGMIQNQNAEMPGGMFQVEQEGQ